MSETANLVPVPDMAQLFRLDGKVAVVTGAGSGIGQMAAGVLAQAGAVAVATDIDAAAAEATAAGIRDLGHRAEARRMDVTDEASVVEGFAAIEAAHGRIDVLVNNAGSSIRSPTVDLGLEAWNRIVALNMTGVFLCAREAGRRMLAQRSGSVINLSSKWGHVSAPTGGNLSYHATKGAVVQMTRHLAVEWGRHGVRVNDIAPTYIRSRLTEPLFQDEAFVAAAEDFAPLGRTGVPNDIAGAILYLASPASSLVTGHSLKVDAGWTAK